MTCALGMVNPNCAKICPKHRRCEEEGSKRWLLEPTKVVPPRKKGKVKGYVENMINPVVAEDRRSQGHEARSNRKSTERNILSLTAHPESVNVDSLTREMQVSNPAYGVSLSPSELQILASLEVTGEDKWIADSL